MDRTGVAVLGLKEGDREEDWAPLAPHLPAERTFRRIIRTEAEFRHRLEAGGPQDRISQALQETGDDHRRGLAVVTFLEAR